MKRILLLSISFGLIALLGISLAGADMPHDPHDHQTGPQGFESQLGQMSVTGTVEVNNAIVVTLTAEPTEDAQMEMRQEAERRPDDRHPLPENMTNSITVSIYELVEFVDVDDNGFTINDTVVSTYALDSANLGEPILSETADGSLYTITSTDNSFVMYLYLNENEGVIHSWKWSVETNYDFQTTDSDLAIVQNIISNGGHSMMGEYREQEQNQVLPVNTTQNCEMVDNHSTVPMFFKWADNATVDGQVLDIIATRTETGLAIAMPQGESIFYDPEIGVDFAVLEGASSLIAELFTSFTDSISSPIVVALVASGVFITLIVMLRRKA